MEVEVEKGDEKQAKAKKQRTRFLPEAEATSMKLVGCKPYAKLELRT